jgi:cysteine desulfuration protein SufE
LSGQTPDDIINAKLEFIEKIDLRSHLSSQRSNGLNAMIKQMKLYAIAFKSKNVTNE